MWTDKSVLLGRYWRSSPLVFSFEPRCHAQTSRHPLGVGEHVPQGDPETERTVTGREDQCAHASAFATSE